MANGQPQHLLLMDKHGKVREWRGEGVEGWIGGAVRGGGMKVGGRRDRWRMEVQTQKQCF